MKFSEAWLQEWLAETVETEHLLDRLTMSGLEVDGMEPVAADFSGVVVAQIQSIAPHPDADKLRICQVNAGAEALQIVCGAPNVYEGMKAPLAMIGARLPGDFKIKKSKLRGVESFGMLCSAKEIGLMDDADGLMDLPQSLTPGDDIREALSLDDNIIEISLTPNRGDCLGLSGIARDVAVFCDVPYAPLASNPTEVSSSHQREVVLTAADACPRYLGRVIAGVDAKQASPLWLQEKLRRSGLRSVSVIVDITNYVMLELGLPMHAFDNDRLDGAIEVRFAKDVEALTLLDGNQIELKADTLVIADQQQALALAGIMGGEASAVTDSTTNIFLECAFFQPLAITGKARQYGLHTDSSHRFERGVDFERQSEAMERATALILDICGGQAGPINEQCMAEHLPKRPAVSLRAEQIARLLGIEVESERVTSIFERLGLAVQTTNDGWSVIPPSYRFDIAIEADLIEEIARVIGYDHIPTQGLESSSTLQRPQGLEPSIKRIRECLVARDYHEVITYSFIEPNLAVAFSAQAPLALANPISADLGVMRASLIPGLVSTLAYNLKRQQPRCRIFETGLVFINDDELEQIPRLAGLISGPRYPEQWDQSAEHVDVFDLKNDLEALLSSFVDTSELKFKPSEQENLHPYQCSRVILSGKDIGLLAALHPQFLKDQGIKQKAVVFEVDLAPICQEKAIKFTEISKFPSIRRDLSLLVDESITVQQLQQSIQNTVSELLSNLQLFGVYQGEGIEIGKKSVTFALTFQGSSSTLVDSEVDAMVDDVLAALQQEFGATLRE